jgi:hypothetical protein
MPWTRSAAPDLLDVTRDLTPEEWAALSPGLKDALETAGVSPVIVSAPAALARIAAVWRGYTPILTLNRAIYWPSAPQDCARRGLEPHMAILQHELQHVLDFSTGALGRWRYVLDPRNWFYRYRLKPGRPWRAYGAEQRASMAEDLWLLERGLEPAAKVSADDLRRLIPWAK